jgi:hypothetical protein
VPTTAIPLGVAISKHFHDSQPITEAICFGKRRFYFLGNNGGVLASNEVFNVMVNTLVCFVNFTAVFWGLAANRFVKFGDFPALLW